MKKCISVSVAFTLLFSYFPVFAQQQRSINDVITMIKNQANYPNYFLVAAHRGYWADNPENSKGAYDMAISAGADIIEMDVRLTRDNQMVVLHDACLDRVTSGNGRLRDEDWSYVSGLYLTLLNGNNSTYRVLLLADALDYLKGKAVVSIDIKEGGADFDDTFVRALQMVKEKGMLNQVILKGKLTYQQLQVVLTRAGVSLSDFIYTPIAFSTTPNLATYITDFVNSNRIYAFELVYKQSADAILNYRSQLQNKHIWVGQYSFWPETSYGIFAEANPLTSCDPVIRDYNFQDRYPSDPLDDGRGDWDWLLSKGANYIITDRSELMIDYLNAIGKRTK